MATKGKDEAPTEVIATPEPEDSAASASTEAADASPVAGHPPTGTGEETAGAADEVIASPGSGPHSGAALAAPSEFTRESLQAAEDAYQRSLAACWPHFAPVRATRYGDKLEFDDPMTGDWQPFTPMTQEWLLDRWEASAHEAIAATFLTNLCHAPEPEPAAMALVAGQVMVSPEGEEEHRTEQMTAVVPRSAINVLPTRWPGVRWPRQRG